MLEVSGLTKRYGSHVVLDGVKAAFATNAIHFVMGPNGAGKSTFLRCLLQLVPYSGEIHWRGRPIDPSERLVFPVLDAAPFYPRLTGRQNLKVLAPEALGRSSAYVDDRLLRQRFGRYSRGQAMRLALTAALQSGTDLVVMDEPANGLDRETMLALRTDLLAMRGERTFVLTGHQLEFYEDIVDTVTLLRGGTLRRVDDSGVRRRSLAEIYDADRPTSAS